MDRIFSNKKYCFLPLPIGVIYGGAIVNIFGLKMRGLTPAQRRERPERVARMLGWEELLDRKLFQKLVGSGEHGIPHRAKRWGVGQIGLGERGHGHVGM